MAKAQSLEAKLARLRSLRGEVSSPEAREELRKALRDASNLVVADAAEVAGKAALTDLAADLVAAFDRLLEHPAKRDKRCRAKIAIVEALNEMEYAKEDIFLRGARYVQLEPVWGGEEDTAAPLRVACAFGLVRLLHRGALPLLVDLLCDPCKAARVGGAQALTYAETEAAALLLRFKARVGDKDPEVISECFAGLLQVRPDDGIPFVAEFLESGPEPVREAAVLALGSSRRREAFEVLKAFWEKPCQSTLQETVLLALGLLRLAAANDFLLSLVATGAPAVAAAAVGALAIHRYDARLVERVAAAVAENGSSALHAYFEKKFAAKD
jgi:HEAT repeat protein